MSLGLAACTPSNEDPGAAWEIESPAGPSSFAPNLLVADGVLILSWLEGADELAEIRLRRFDGRGPGNEPMVVARTAPSRASGFPRLARVGDHVYLARVDIEAEAASQVRFDRIPISTIN